MTGCYIGGSELHVVGDAMRLCGEPGRRCFGSIAGGGGARPMPMLTSLHVETSVDARVVLSGAGLTVTASTDVASIAIHPRTVRPIDGWFVPTDHRLRVGSLLGDTLEVRPEPGVHLRLVRPLEDRWPCDELSSDVFRADEPDVIAALRHGPDLGRVHVVEPSIALRAFRGGPTVAWLDASGKHAQLLARDAHEVRIRIGLDRAWIVAWADESAFSTPKPWGSRRTRPPRVRMGATSKGARCPYPLDVVFETPEGDVGAGHIAAGTPFDPVHVAGTFREMFDVLPGVKARVEPGELVGCEDTEVSSR